MEHPVEFSTANCAIPEKKVVLVLLKYEIKEINYQGITSGIEQILTYLVIIINLLLILRR